MEAILYSKECNWYTRCCPLNGGVRYRECPLREAILFKRIVSIVLYTQTYTHIHVYVSINVYYAIITSHSISLEKGHHKQFFHKDSSGFGSHEAKRGGGEKGEE